MNKQSEIVQYDDDEAVKFIQNYLPNDLKGKFSDDEINYVIDIVYDFYEDKGFMNADVDEDQVVEISEDDIIFYVDKSVKKDKVFKFTSDEIMFVVQGELAYCDYIGLFE